MKDNEATGKNLIVDVRPQVEFEICHLPNSISSFSSGLIHFSLQGLLNISLLFIRYTRHPIIEAYRKPASGH